MATTTSGKNAESNTDKVERATAKASARAHDTVDSTADAAEDAAHKVAPAIEQIAQRAHQAVDSAHVSSDAGRVNAGGGVFDEISNAFASAREGVAALMELLLLEARRASLSLVWMLVCALIAAVCFIAVWIGLSAALALWMMSAGVDALLAVLSVTGINLLAGAGFIGACVLMSRNLGFPATRLGIRAWGRIRMEPACSLARQRRPDEKSGIPGRARQRFSAWPARVALPVVAGARAPCA